MRLILNIYKKNYLSYHRGKLFLSFNAFFPCLEKATAILINALGLIIFAFLDDE